MRVSSTPGSFTIAANSGSPTYSFGIGPSCAYVGQPNGLVSRIAGRGAARAGATETSKAVASSQRMADTLARLRGRKLRFSAPRREHVLIRRRPERGREPAEEVMWCEARD